MDKMPASPLQEALEIVETLSTEDQETLIDILSHRLVESRRAEIAKNAKTTLRTISEGKAQFGSLDNLKRDLLDEP